VKALNSWTKRLSLTTIFFLVLNLPHLRNFFGKKWGKNVQIQGKVVNNKKVAKNLK